MNPLPRSRTSSFVSVDHHVDRRAVRAVLQRVVHEVSDGPFDHLRTHEHRGVAGRGHLDLAAAPAARHARRHPVRGRRAPPISSASLLPELSPASSTSSDTRSVSSWISSCTPSTTSSYSPGASSSARAEQLGVRPEARERRTQLVACVADQPLLLASGRGERVDHRGEAARQAADLGRTVGRASEW